MIRVNLILLKKIHFILLPILFFFLSYALPMYNPMLDQYEIACSLALPQRGNILPRDIISNLVLSKNSFSPGAP
nr:hypothetical protein Q903MT_gene6056 [Picea sitchensis]